MSIVFKELLGLIVVGVLVACFFSNSPKEVRYDCSIAEISPDIPIKVKEQCRKLRQ